MSFFIIFLSSPTIISFQFSSWQFPFLSTILSYHLINVVSFLISFNSVKFLYFLLVYFHCSVPSWKYYIYSLGYECMYTRPPPSLPPPQIQHEGVENLYKYKHTLTVLWSMLRMHAWTWVSSRTILMSISDPDCMNHACRRWTLDWSDLMWGMLRT